MANEPDNSADPFDPMAYRRALGGFGTGVALVAAHDAEGRAHGLVINSLTSVSLNPPIMLWCLANSSNAFPVFTNAAAFSLNILRSDDHEVAQRFSRKGDRLIPADQTCIMETGAPCLSAAVASLDCRMRLRQPMGDHEVIYGDVISYRGDHGVDALGFFRGKFVTLKSGETGS
ncbi:MAG TPA: flavin reductase family protein [Hyphomonadaceae bacterium]|jgi:flavin reductase (DIM6/NTAB) family NADH-FMN oxidoreductase RutF|nr:flavin reductase family protein [Hyphomonadaceae bacterium]